MAAPVAFVLPSFAGGGAERVIVTLANHLPPSRFRSTLVMLRADGPLRALVAPHVEVVDLDRPRVRHARGALARTLRAMAPAVVVSTMAHLNLGLLSIRHRLPAATRIVVREANDPAATVRQWGKPWLLRLLYRHYYPRADIVLSPTRAIEGTLAAFGVPRGRLSVMPNPVDVLALRQNAASPQREPGDGLRFVAAGRLTEQKGFDRLLDMLARLPGDARLTVFGDGPLEAALHSQAQALDIAGRVRFAGFVGNPWPHFAGADAFLLPSRWEGLPNAALEAMACGTPVIATPEAGGIAEVAELADAGAVTLAQAGAEFAAAMAAMHPDPVRAPRPSLLPDTFALDTIVDRFTQMLGSLSAGAD